MRKTVSAWLVVSVAIAAPSFAAQARMAKAAAGAPGSTSIIPRGAEWSYYAPMGVPADGWKLGEGSDGWKVGITKIGWGDTGLATEFSSLENASELYPVAHFRRTFTHAKTLKTKSVRFVMYCDDGCVAYLNGKEVGRGRVPRGTAGYTKEYSPPDKSVTIELPATELKDGQNTIAVEVHQSGADSSDMMFDAEMSSM